MMLGKIEGRRRGRQRMRWLDGITELMDMSKLLGHSEGHGSTHGVAKTWTERLNNSNSRSQNRGLVEESLLVARHV